MQHALKYLQKNAKLINHVTWGLVTWYTATKQFVFMYVVGICYIALPCNIFYINGCMVMHSMPICCWYTKGGIIIKNAHVKFENMAI